MIHGGTDGAPGWHPASAFTSRTFQPTKPGPSPQPPPDSRKPVTGMRRPGPRHRTTTFAQHEGRGVSRRALRFAAIREGVGSRRPVGLASQVMTQSNLPRVASPGIVLGLLHARDAPNGTMPLTCILTKVCGHS